MKIEKEQHKVSIVCEDNSLVKGLIHINPGERVSDFFNDPKEAFLVVTDAEVSNVKGMGSVFPLGANKEKTLIVNKASIKFIEEI